MNKCESFYHLPKIRAGIFACLILATRAPAPCLEVGRCFFIVAIVQAAWAVLIRSGVTREWWKTKTGHQG